jgi:hypothetical protein
MNKKIIIRAAHKSTRQRCTSLLMLLCTYALMHLCSYVLNSAVSTCRASECKRACEYPKSSGKKQPVEEKTNAVDTVLKQLNKKTSELMSYQAQIEYNFIQPLFESEKLQKGVFCYAKLGKESKLRLNFQTRKIEDEEEEKYAVQYIVLDGVYLSHPDYQFKGTWAVLIDYEIEAVKYYQLAEAKEPNKPVDVFDLASRNFPMVGFTKMEDMKKQFEVTLVEQKKSEPEDFIQVHLKVKPNSVYKHDYISIDFWIDKKLGLPAKIVAVTTEEDIYRIKFLKPKVNKGMDKKVFEFKIPEGFDEPEIIPLKKKGERK